MRERTQKVTSVASFPAAHGAGSRSPVRTCLLGAGIPPSCSSSLSGSPLCWLAAAIVDTTRRGISPLFLCRQEAMPASLPPRGTLPRAQSSGSIAKHPSCMNPEPCRRAAPTDAWLVPKEDLSEMRVTFCWLSDSGDQEHVSTGDMRLELMTAHVVLTRFCGRTFEECRILLCYRSSYPFFSTHAQDQAAAAEVHDQGLFLHAATEGSTGMLCTKCCAALGQTWRRHR